MLLSSALSRFHTAAFVDLWKSFHSTGSPTHVCVMNLYLNVSHKTKQESIRKIGLHTVYWESLHKRHLQEKLWKSQLHAHAFSLVKLKSFFSLLQYIELRIQIDRTDAQWIMLCSNETCKQDPHRTDEQRSIIHNMYHALTSICKKQCLPLHVNQISADFPVRWFDQRLERQLFCL